jgi:beta-glucosidase
MNKIFLVIFGVFSFLLTTGLSGQSKNQFKEERIEQRVDSLINLMTLEEKIGQLTQYPNDNLLTGPAVFNEHKIEDLRNGKVGSYLGVSGADFSRQMQDIAIKETRLHIPLIFGLDVIHGFRTIFPIPLGEAASWDPSVWEASARVAATEAAASGVHWTFAPMVDICRDARWGRIMEGAGEDPYLGSVAAKARVKGFQGISLSADSTIVACAKHYAAYGGAMGGRDYNSVDMSERMLRDIYLPPFKAASDAGCGTFMSAFNDLSGVPSSGNQFLLDQVLRKEWGFNGFVVSDWNSVKELINHGYAANDYEAAMKGLTAGVDMDMCSGVYRNNLAQLVKDGKVSIQQIDESVRRILRYKFKLGLFDDPYKYCNAEREKKLILCPRHQAIERDAARKSIVLLKNDKDILPLSKNLRSIAVIGPLADNKHELNGNWAAEGRAEDCISLIQGIKKAVSPTTKILYAKGCNINDDTLQYIDQAVKVAKNADVIIAAVGESAMMSGEAHSRAYTIIPGEQEQLLKALLKTGKPVIMVLMNGRPLCINWEKDNLSAILETWFLGTQAGNAIADVLFGDYNPSGKLTVSFPYAIGQIPVFYNYKSTGRPYNGTPYTTCYMDIPNDPLYPFGYGLSYTKFDISAPMLDRNVISSDDTLHISVKVKNTGKRSGAEVVQLYIRDVSGSVTRPVKELKGFNKVFLDPGQEKLVDFALTTKDLASYDINMKFTAEPGEFRLFVGSSSVDVKETRFMLK